MYDRILKLYKLGGTKTEHSDVTTYGNISKIYITHIRIYLFFRFTVKVRGTKTEHSDVATYGRRIHVYIYILVCFEHSTVDTYGRISKLFTPTYIFISSFVSLTKYVGQKMKTLMWLKMAGEFISTYIHAYGSFFVLRTLSVKRRKR